MLTRTAATPSPTRSLGVRPEWQSLAGLLSRIALTALPSIPAQAPRSSLGRLSSLAAVRVGRPRPARAAPPEGPGPPGPGPWWRSLARVPSRPSLAVTLRKKTQGLKMREGGEGRPGCFEAPSPVTRRPQFVSVSSWVFTAAIASGVGHLDCELCLRAVTEEGQEACKTQRWREENSCACARRMRLWDSPRALEPDDMYTASVFAYSNPARGPTVFTGVAASQSARRKRAMKLSVDGACMSLRAALAMVPTY
jgi:hypothetical protein